MRKIVFGLLISTSFVSFTSCSCFKKNTDLAENIDKPQAYQLNNTNWSLVRFDAQNRDFKSIENSIINLTFSEGAFSSSDGCNSFGASFTQQNNYLSFGDIRSTKKYCTEEYMQENGYKIPFHKVDQFSVEKDILKLYDKEANVIATYKKSK